MKFQELVKERLLTALLTALLSATGFVLISIAKETTRHFSAYIVPAIGANNILWLCLLLLLMSLILGAWVLVLIYGNRAKWVRKRYEFLPDKGYYRHKKTGEKVCGNCLLSGRESPLGKTVYQNENWWQCTEKACAMSYSRHD